jgi:DNA-binding protein HU-beta
LTPACAIGSNHFCFIHAHVIFLGHDKSASDNRYNSAFQQKIIHLGVNVNKTELIEHIAKNADTSKASAARSLEAMMDAVRKTLKKGGTVSLVGFGTFAVGKRAARLGRNPRTGDTIKIKAAKVPKFRPGKGLKDALNGGK